MKWDKCWDCGDITYNGLPFCNKCLKEKWECEKKFIRPKHNPFRLPWARDKDRSVVTAECVTNKELFIAEIIDDGECFVDNEHGNFCYVLHKGLGCVAGSVVPAYHPWPEYPLDSIFIADAIGKPHAFAVDYLYVEYQVKNGIFSIPK